MDLLAGFDAVIVFACSVLAKIVYVDIYLGEARGFGDFLAIGALGALFASLFFRLRIPYDMVGLHRGIRVRPAAVIGGLAFSMIIIITLGFLLHIAHFYSRAWILIWTCFSFIGIVTTRVIAGRILGRLARRGFFKQHIAILGGGAGVGQMLDGFNSDLERFELFGVFSEISLESSGSETTDCIPVDGDLDDLVGHCRQGRVDLVVVTIPVSERDRLKRAIEILDQLPTRICLYADFVDIRFRRPSIQRLGSVNLIEIQKTPLSGGQLLIKSVMDYLFSAMLLLLLSPMLLLIAVLIKLDTPGPVLFWQKRQGFNRGVIEMAKFRTMIADQSEDSGVERQATRTDRRVTSVGRFLRRTSLDELPQLYNVLKGEMSLIGPRPHALFTDDEYVEIIDKYASRHKVKPGITGWAQVNGWRGGIGGPEAMEKRIEHDLYYIDHWSIWLDIRILLLLTLPAVLNRKNAY